MSEQLIRQVTEQLKIIGNVVRRDPEHHQSHFLCQCRGAKKNELVAGLVPLSFNVLALLKYSISPILHLVIALNRIAYTLSTN